MVPDVTFWSANCTLVTTFDRITIKMHFLIHSLDTVLIGICDFNSHTVTEFHGYQKKIRRWSHSTANMQVGLSIFRISAHVVKKT